MEELNLESIFDIMLTAAKSAGEIQTSYFGKKVQTQEKTSHTDLVTEVDFLSQKAIIEEISKGLAKKGYNLENFGFVGEENINSKSKYNFIIDPLDGTMNFAIGLELFSVLIAFEIDNKIQIGLIYRPIYKDYYYAILGHGAKKVSKTETKILKISEKTEKEIILGIKHNSFEFIKPEFLINIRSCRQVYGIGVECGYLAEGVFDINFYISHRGPRIWDIAATKIIIEEAGGLFVDKDNKPVKIEVDNYEKKYRCIAGHPKNIDKIIPYLQNLDNLPLK